MVEEKEEREEGSQEQTTNEMSELQRYNGGNKKHCKTRKWAKQTRGQIII